MLENKTAGPDKSSPKEVAMQEITLQLMTSLSSLKESLGDKKFEKRVKKAARLLTSGISKTSPAEKPASKKVPVKKVTKKASPKKVTKKSSTAMPIKKSAPKAGLKKR